MIVFSYYGPVRKVWVAQNPHGFAFIEFEDERDAEDAVRGLDGTSVCGSRVRVEHATGKVKRSSDEVFDFPPPYSPQNLFVSNFVFCSLHV